MKLSIYFSRISTSEAPEEIEEAASNLVGALDLVVDAAREQFVSTAAVVSDYSEEFPLDFMINTHTDQYLHIIGYRIVTAI